MDLCREFPEVADKMRQQTFKYKDPWKTLQIKLLSEVDYLERLPYNLKEELHYRMKSQIFDNG